MDAPYFEGGLGHRQVQPQLPRHEVVAPNCDSRLASCRQGEAAFGEKALISGRLLS